MAAPHATWLERFATANSETLLVAVASIALVVFAALNTRLLLVFRRELTALASSNRSRRQRRRRGSGGSLLDFDGLTHASAGGLHRRMASGGKAAVSNMSVNAPLDERTPLVHRESYGTLDSSGDVDIQADAGHPRTHPKLVMLLVALVVGLLVYLLPILEDKQAAHRCLGILCGISIIWATEAIPLHITSLFIPLPCVLFRVMLYEDGTTMDAQDAAAELAGSFFQSVIMLFLGGFTIGAALDKYSINKSVATYVLRLAGTNPRRLLLAIMVLGVVASMWISNVAAAVLCVSVVLPIINKLPTGSVYSKVLLLGIAYSCNVGGMTTPIASPQNAIALESIQDASGEPFSFVQWMLLAMPLCLMFTVILWAFLLAFYRPKVQELPAIKATTLTMTFDHWLIIGTTSATVLLWIFEDYTVDWFGDIGIIALIPVVVFFGSGILNGEDFDNIGWNVLILMGGGLALGDAIESSLLLDTIAESLGDAVISKGPWVVLLTFTCLMWVIANFISSSVSAFIVLPVVAQVGYSIGHTAMLCVLGAIMCSGAMGLPVSSFPNANSFATRDLHGNKILQAVDYSKTGFIAGFFVCSICLSAGYFLAIAMGL